MCTMISSSEPTTEGGASPKVCKFEGCGRGPGARGLCPGHYAQFKKGQELRPIIPAQANAGKICGGPDCPHPAATKGLCSAHYSQKKRWGELLPLGARRPGPARIYDGVLCSFNECEKQAIARGLCNAHAQQLRRTGSLVPIGTRKVRPKIPCAHEQCDQDAKRRDWCEVHYRQHLRNGYTKLARETTNLGWSINPSGYVVVKKPGHSEVGATGWGLEHRVVMSDHLGRPLWPDENVHHKNGDRTDNRVENLELWSRRQPPGQRVVDKLAWAREIIERYGDDPHFA